MDKDKSMVVDSLFANTKNDKNQLKHENIELVYKKRYVFGTSNKDIAHLLRSVAAAYLIKGGNRFKIIAYQNAADEVEHLSREIKDIWEEGKLYSISNIGPSIASHIDEYFKKGYSSHFVEVFKGIPFNVFELMKVRSIGPKRAYKLVTSLNLYNPKSLFDDLKQACLEGRVAALPGFGEKSQKEILNAIELYLKTSSKTERMTLPYAYRVAEDIVEYMKKNPFVKKAEVLGSLRRMSPTIGDIDIAVVSTNNKAVIEHFINYPKKNKVENAGETKASIILHPNIRVDLRVIDEERFGSMLQYFTGSKAHNIKLREYALKKGFSLSEYGIKRLSDGKMFKFSTEEEFYKFLGLQYIPPEIREGGDEIELASKHKLPQLIEVKDIKGEFHIHSNYDLKPSHDLGNHSYEELLEKADNLGYAFLGFADHNPSISGNTKQDILLILKKRKQIIDKIISSKKFERIKIFIGLEVDILPDGNLAIPISCLEYVDFIIAAVHSSFDLPVDKMTERILKALSFPKVKIFGHPTGRLLGKREGYELDWERVFTFAKRRNIALEINSWPMRLDLSDTLIKEAVSYGCIFVINTDAHSKDHLDNIKFGVAMARRGWLTKENVVNAWNLDKIEEWIKS